MRTRKAICVIAMVGMLAFSLAACSTAPSDTVVSMVKYLAQAAGFATSQVSKSLDPAISYDISLAVTGLCTLSISADTVGATTDKVSLLLAKVWTGSAAIGPIGSVAVTAVNDLWGYLKDKISSSSAKASVSVVYLQAAIDGFCKGFIGSVPVNSACLHPTQWWVTHVLAPPMFS